MVSRGRVERVMRHQGIRAITPRRFRICTTGSVRRECTDHLIAFNADHLRRILAKYAIYYIEMRTHVSLGKDAPCTRPIERFGDVVAHPILGGPRDFQTTGVVAFAKGCPISRLPVGKQDIGGHRVQVKEDYRRDCASAVNQIAAKL
jgi:hypothetical protein